LPNRPLKKPAITLVEAKGREEEGWLILFETNARWESVVARLD